ncbi:MAG: hypothetical protein KJ767_03660 [Nanoarchaeota archaeon]|nr:hypothetical protein [Nanoarchaeota archaeon]
MPESTSSRSSVNFTNMGFQNLQGTLLGSIISGAIIFGAIFGILFGITGFALFGFAGVFGILAGIVLGMAVGAGLGFLFTLTTSEKTGPITKKLILAGILASLFGYFGYAFLGIFGFWIGIAVGMALGFLMPPEALSTIIAFSIVVFIIYIAFLWWQSGALELFFSPLGFSSERIMLGLERGVTCMTDPIQCFFKPFYDWSEPTVENKEEEVSVKVDFSTTQSVYFEKEKISIRTAIIVNNPTEDAYYTRPLCYLDGEPLDVEETSKVQNGMIYFGKSNVEQRATVVCENKDGLELEEGKDAQAFDFELHLIRPVKTKTEWNVYTMNEQILKNKANPFEDVNEPNLRNRVVLSNMLFDSPVKISAGSNDDQPFSDAKSIPFFIAFQKKDIYGEILAVDSLKIENPISSVVSISDCESFTRGSDGYYLTRDKLTKISSLANERDIPIFINCYLSVSGTRMDRQVPEKTVIKVESEFGFESVYKKSITVISEGQKQEI